MLPAALPVCTSLNVRMKYLQPRDDVGAGEKRDTPIVECENFGWLSGGPPSTWPAKRRNRLDDRVLIECSGNVRSTPVRRLAFRRKSQSFHASFTCGGQNSSDDEHRSAPSLFRTGPGLASSLAQAHLLLAGWARACAPQTRALSPAPSSSRARPSTILLPRLL
eukprot:6173860-Pleurochrysis_carterae.AAC.1